MPVFRYRGISKAYSVIVLILIGICVQKTFFSANFYELVAKRNFYGIVSARILPSIGELGLFNGSICHGSQIINFKNKQLVFKPTTYYIESSGVGITDRVMRIRKNGKPLKICTIGLGIGTNAYYGQKGDTITYYELNPDVLYIANNLFTFLKNSKADIKIILGDGRLTLEKQPPQNYDIIIIDAFNNDSIPLHLLTKEAINLYLKHLNHDGLLVFNISNKYVNIEKALSNLSIDLDLQETALDSRAKYNCFYSIISRDNWFMNYVYSDSFKKEYPNVIYNKPKWYKETGIWTDDYTNLISVMKDFKIK